MIRKPVPSPSCCKYKLTLEYDGTGYSGWQVQKNARSIQGTLIDAARELFGTEVEVQGRDGPTPASTPLPRSPTSTPRAASRRRGSFMVSTTCSPRRSTSSRWKRRPLASTPATWPLGGAIST